MGREIERKFLVAGDGWRTTSGVRFTQGYLSRIPERTVRVRIAGPRAFLTIKGKTDGATRAEFEYEIPVADAEALLALCEPGRIDKTRHTLDHDGHTWEIDEFHGAHQGLLLAEIELDHEDEPFTRPPWLGAEVTHNPRYYNATLSRPTPKD